MEANYYLIYLIMKALLIFLLIIILGTIFSSKEKFKIQYLAPLNLPYGKNKSNHKKVLIEFVSANPTGPLTVGHGRGAILGDVIT